MKWYTYVVECADSALYAGITTDLKRRVFEHNNKLGAKSLRGKLPVRLVYQEEFETNKEAAKREREIKGWRRSRKLKLVGAR